MSKKKDATTRAAKGSTSAVGLKPTKTTFDGYALRALRLITGSVIVEKLGLRDEINELVYQGTKTGFKSVALASRAFKKVSGGGKGKRLPENASKAAGYFDLTPNDEQKMIVETVADFADEILRPAAHDADHNATFPKELSEKAAELGITMINVPEELEGAASERGAVTNVLVAEALARGDMGLALPLLAPSGVAVALAQWGTEGQQQTYLPDFTGESVPNSAVVISEPTALFNPFALSTKATRTPSGFKISGTKSLVPAAAACELFIVGAELEGRPAFFIVEAGTAGVTVQADPSMGLRGAELGRLNLENVTVPSDALLGEGSASELATDYAEGVRLARLGWAALATGTGQAVLDYVIPYVKEREAFGEPIAHRQSVAFMVANIAIELEGIRLVTLRGASRAEQGLDFGREAALAKKLATDHGMRIGLDGVQLLGGHGFTQEHPVERWYRDLRAVGVAEGVVLV